MRAAWWWIDRWRKSTAYICMSLEEQGIYRNLLDALWLFDGKPIPDEPRALISAAGGPSQEEWDRCWPKIQKWMRRVEGGWTNDTAAEMITDTAKIAAARSQAGKRGADSKWHGKSMASGMATGMPKTCPPSPSPYSESETDPKETDSSPSGSVSVSRNRVSEEDLKSGWTALTSSAARPESWKLTAARRIRIQAIIRDEGLDAVIRVGHWVRDSGDERAVFLRKRGDIDTLIRASKFPTYMAMSMPKPERKELVSTCPHCNNTGRVAHNGNAQDFCDCPIGSGFFRESGLGTRV